MCTSPKKAWLPINSDQDNKKTLLFKPPVVTKLHLYENIETPCNHCVACEKLRSLRTAIQLACELNTTPGESWFVTLTYDDENLPNDFSVHKDHLQKFIKKLRKWRTKTNHIGNFRYLSQGEYGGKFQRPHYHLAGFNLTLPDLRSVASKGSYPAFESEQITKIWGHGNVHLIRLCFENCLYIAQHHIDEKVDNKVKTHETPIRHPVTNKLIKIRNTEFSTRSSKPGIGKDFFEKYFSDIYPCDYMINKGQKMPVPRYFDKLLKDQAPEIYEGIKQQRSEKVEEKTPAQNRYQDKFNRAKLKSKQ